MTGLSGRFTANKQVVRDLQFELIAKTFQERLGNLRYFGLCSPEMKDLQDWGLILSSVVAVERGIPGKEHEDQHSLLLSAARLGFMEKISLLRGDIDEVLLTGEDLYGNHIVFPFDIVSLDYSGGLFYRDQQGDFRRLRALEQLIRDQASHRLPSLLFLSCNLDAVDAGEVRHTIENMRTELRRGGFNAEEVFDSYLRHADDIPRMKLFVPHFVNQISANERMTCQTHPVISYPGNRGIEMLNFRFLLKPDLRTMTPRFPRERLSQVVNMPMIRIENGIQKKTMMEMPKLRTIADTESE